MENENRGYPRQKQHRDTNYSQPTLLKKLLNKKVICTLSVYGSIGSNPIELEGILIGISQYEIVLSTGKEETVVFKHALVMIKEIKD